MSRTKHVVLMASVASIRTAFCETAFKLLKTPDYISPHSAILTCNFGLYSFRQLRASSILRPPPSDFLSAHTLREEHGDIRLPKMRWKKKGRNLTYLLFAPVGTFSIFRTVNKPSMTRPKTQCFPSRNSAGAVVMKNYWAKSNQFLFGFFFFSWLDTTGAVEVGGWEAYLASVGVRSGIRLWKVNSDASATFRISAFYIPPQTAAQRGRQWGWGIKYINVPYSTTQVLYASL